MCYLRIEAKQASLTMHACEEINIGGKNKTCNYITSDVAQAYSHYPFEIMEQTIKWTSTLPHTKKNKV